MKTRVLALIIVAGMVWGCDPASDEPAHQETADSTSGEAYPRLAWRSMTPDGEELSASGGPITTTDKGWAYVEDRFEELDWNNPESKPSMTVELDGDQSLTITLSPTASGDGGDMVAVWNRSGPPLGKASTLISRRSKPLGDQAQALAMLKSFCKQDEQFESLVEWSE